MTEFSDIDEYLDTACWNMSFGLFTDEDGTVIPVRNMSKMEIKFRIARLIISDNPMKEDWIDFFQEELKRRKEENGREK